MRSPMERRSSLPTVLAMIVTLALGLFLHAAPTRIPQGPDLLPLLPLIVLYIWSVRRPSFVSPAVIFFVGLLQDLLSGGPMGVWAFSYLVAFGLARHRDADGAGLDPIPASARFAALAAIAFACAWVTGSAALGRVAGGGALLVEGVFTILIFPVFAWAFARRRERGAFA